jgi:hypothetical protein
MEKERGDDYEEIEWKEVRREVRLMGRETMVGGGGREQR